MGLSAGIDVAAILHRALDEIFTPILGIIIFSVRPQHILIASSSYLYYIPVHGHLSNYIGPSELRFQTPASYFAGSCIIGRPLAVFVPAGTCTWMQHPQLFSRQ